MKNEEWKKKSKDMRYLTEIERRIHAEEELTGEELAFLYEIDSPIEGFGLVKDPRIAKVRSTRDVYLDAAIISKCDRKNIATNGNEVTTDTQMYIGRL